MESPDQCDPGFSYGEFQLQQPCQGDYRYGCMVQDVEPWLADRIQQADSAVSRYGQNNNNGNLNHNMWDHLHSPPTAKVYTGLDYYAAGKNMTENVLT
jgi:hypothetical protein